MSGTDTDTSKDDATKDKATDTSGAGSDAGKGDANQGGTDDKAGDKSKKDEDPAAGLKSALKKERERADKAEKAIREAELAKLPELERFKTQVDELTKENEKLKTENLRRQIGMELGLPWNLARRISGDDEPAMREDAADLLKHFKHEESEKDTGADKDKANKKTPTNDGKKTGGTGAKDMNFLLRRAAGRA